MGSKEERILRLPVGYQLSKTKDRPGSLGGLFHFLSN
jgi:hypothetical protein